jgi:hypothetical protein
MGCTIFYESTDEPVRLFLRLGILAIEHYAHDVIYSRTC